MKGMTDALEGNFIGRIFWEFAPKQDKLRLAAEDIRQIMQRMLNEMSIAPLSVER